MEILWRSSPRGGSFSSSISGCLWVSCETPYPGLLQMPEDQVSSSERLNKYTEGKSTEVYLTQRGNISGSEKSLRNKLFKAAIPLFLYSCLSGHSRKWDLRQKGRLLSCCTVTSMMLHFIGFPSPPDLHPLNAQEVSTTSAELNAEWLSSGWSNETGTYGKRW